MDVKRQRRQRDKLGDVIVQERKDKGLTRLKQ